MMVKYSSRNEFETKQARKAQIQKALRWLVGIALVVALIVQFGCATADIVVVPVENEFGIPECQVNGEIEPYSIEENRRITQRIVDLHCGID